MHPNTFNDVNGRYLGFDNQVRALPPGHPQYADFSDWDTYRSLAPLHGMLLWPTAVDQTPGAYQERRGIADYLARGYLPNNDASRGDHARVGASITAARPGRPVPRRPRVPPARARQVRPGRFRRGQRRAVHLAGAAEPGRAGHRDGWPGRGGRTARHVLPEAERRTQRAVHVGGQRAGLRRAVAGQLRRAAVEDAGSRPPHRHHALQRGPRRRTRQRRSRRAVLVVRLGRAGHLPRRPRAPRTSRCSRCRAGARSTSARQARRRPRRTCTV